MKMPGQVIHCIAEAHNRNLVVNNLDLATFERFPLNVWKIADLDSVTEVGTRTRVNVNMLFKAPEIVLADAEEVSASISADLWSLGIIFFYVLTGNIVSVNCSSGYVPCLYRRTRLRQKSNCRGR